MVQNSINMVTHFFRISLSNELKIFQNMSDALAERLLDLHCRLISLYILQDVDCLNWSSEYQFFEGERSSFTIQMWWLYVQGENFDLSKLEIQLPSSDIIALL